MKKLGIFLIAICGASVSWLIVLRLTGVLQYYVIPTGANEPNIKVDAHLLALAYKKPKKLDFICFNAIDPATNSTEIYVYRLCATGGDKVEIKDGVLFVNGQNMDSKIQLDREYRVSKQQLQEIAKSGRSIDNSMWWDVSPDTVAAFTNARFILENKIAARLFISPKGYRDELMLKRWGENWNADQFGPVIVPENNFFVLGDNRHNAMDSRYRGFIPLSDLKGTVLKVIN